MATVGRLDLSTYDESGIFALSQGYLRRLRGVHWLPGALRTRLRLCQYDEFGISALNQG